jgi:hypothetical protein
MTTVVKLFKYGIFVLLQALTVPSYADVCQGKCANAIDVRQCLKDCVNSPKLQPNKAIPIEASPKVEKMDTSVKTQPTIGKMCTAGEQWDAAKGACVEVKKATPIQLPQMR